MVSECLLNYLLVFLDDTTLCIIFMIGTENIKQPKAVKHITRLLLCLNESACVCAETNMWHAILDPGYTHIAHGHIHTLN